MPRNIDPSFVDSMTPNFAQLFLDRVATSSTLEAYRFPKGSAWESVTWQQAGDRVSNLAAGAHHGEVGEDPLVAGRRRDADALLGLDAEREQPGREVADPVTGLLPRHRLPAVALREPIGLEGG